MHGNQGHISYSWHEVDKDAVHVTIQLLATIHLAGASSRMIMTKSPNQLHHKYQDCKHSEY